MTILDYYRLIDPRYGSQEHQRAFLQRMERADVLHPCRKDHVALSDKPPTHTHRCYPTERDGRMVGT